MKEITTTPAARPAWVDEALEQLDAIDRAVVEVQDWLVKAMLHLREHDLGEPANELSQAFHDAEHLWEHVTATRRALRMTWPDEEPAR